VSEHLVDVIDEVKLKRLFHFIRNVGQVFFVALGDNNFTDARTFGGERFFL